MDMIELAERVEADFAKLLATGWPEKTSYPKPQRQEPRFGVLDLMLAQLPDSSVTETRFYWRKKLGFSDDVANDTRPLAAILRALAAKDERHD